MAVVWSNYVEEKRKLNEEGIRGRIELDE